jgi:cytochrome c oxidase cbb3-type subunit I/II
VKALPNKIRKQVALGVPWPALNKHEIRTWWKPSPRKSPSHSSTPRSSFPAKPDLQGDALRNHLAKSQVVAVIAYMQKLGSYREVKKDVPYQSARSRHTAHDGALK